MCLIQCDLLVLKQPEPLLVKLFSSNMSDGEPACTENVLNTRHKSLYTLMWKIYLLPLHALIFTEISATYG